MDIEAIDLARVAAHLRRRSGGFVSGFVVGRTVLRDSVAELLDCSQLEAENVVETMIGRGFIIERRAELGGATTDWEICSPPSDNAAR